MTSVDQGQTATYTYDALNRRFRVKNVQDTVDYQFDVLGRRAIAWRESTDFGIRDSYYWGSQAIAYHSLDGTSYYEQQDWLGTERVRTNSAGNTVASYTSLPFGDGLSNTSSSDEVPDHFASTERDKESLTDHAQFRQYQETLGRWMSPDPYDGSYDINNPQSLNRYSYVLNNPLTFVDPSGLYCWGNEDNSVQECTVDGGGGGSGYGCWFCSHYGGSPLPGSGGGAGGFAPGPPPPPSPSAPPAQLPALNKLGCSTVLPNGNTLGQYINQGRVQLQASKAPLATFASIARDYGQIDFKNGAAGKSVLATNLGQAGNFAYYTIGSGYLSPGTLDFGASVYSVAATVPYPGHAGKRFSTIGNGPMLIDDSANSVRNAGLATPGCP